MLHMWSLPFTCFTCCPKQIPWWHMLHTSPETNPANYIWCTRRPMRIPFLTHGTRLPEESFRLNKVHMSPVKNTLGDTCRTWHPIWILCFTCCMCSPTRRPRRIPLAKHIAHIARDKSLLIYDFHMLYMINMSYTTNTSVTHDAHVVPTFHVFRMLYNTNTSFKTCAHQSLISNGWHISIGVHI